jgi:hypothetical protein
VESIPHSTTSDLMIRSNQPRRLIDDNVQPPAASPPSIPAAAEPQYTAHLHPLINVGSLREYAAYNPGDNPPPTSTSDSKHGQIPFKSIVAGAVLHSESIADHSAVRQIRRKFLRRQSQPCLLLATKPAGSSPVQSARQPNHPAAKQF